MSHSKKHKEHDRSAKKGRSTTKRGRHYRRGMPDGNWKKFKPSFRCIDAWLEKTGHRRFRKPQLENYIDHLIKKKGALDWKKSKIDEYRQGLEHWLNINSSDPEWWNTKTNKYWDYSWKGLWYQSKKGKNIPRSEDKENITAVFNKKRLKRTLELMKIQPGLVPVRARRRVVAKAMKVIHGCCLRKREFQFMQVGDYNHKRRRLWVRSNKGKTLRNGDHSSVYGQWITVIQSSVHEILKNRQIKKASRETSDDPLMFRHNEAAAKHVLKTIQNCAKLEKWDEGLKWCMHAARHGGAQDLVRRYHESQKTSNPMSRKDLIDAIHMESGTLDKTYGVPTEAAPKKK